ncbi:MAG: hypothetical protein LBJ67_11940 [Planctomycetaceae bacterium]|nr:hypothetical protein [Planctomycetaceae bacterium]
MRKPANLMHGQRKAASTGRVEARPQEGSRHDYGQRRAATMGRREPPAWDAKCC